MEVYYLVTIFRLGKFENVYINWTFSGFKNELDQKLADFVLFEKELGRETCIINYLAITESQYKLGIKK
jgi:hypothetical protein